MKPSMQHLRDVSRTLSAVRACGIDPRTAPLPRKREIIEAATTKAALCNSSHALATLQIELLLDIRDLIGECAVRLSEIAAERTP